MDEQGNLEEDDEVLERLTIQVHKLKLANGTEATQIQGTDDLILALNMLHDAQSVMVQVLTKREMEGGGGKEKPRIIIPSMTISQN